MIHSKKRSVWSTISLPVRQLAFGFFWPKTARAINPRNEPDITSTDAQLVEIWNLLRLRYFPESANLTNYRVTWSNRKHTATLATCNTEKQRVRIAATLQAPQWQWTLEPLIYHEMCHAYLGKPEIRRGRRIVHGKAFRTLERRHPLIQTLDQWIKDGGWTAAVRASRRKRRIGAHR